MPKLIDRFLVAKLTSVEQISEKDYEEWKWREEFLNFESVLTIYESTQRFKGQRYIEFDDYCGNYMQTGYGEYTITGDELVMTTKNSIYKFKIIYRGEKSAKKTTDKW